MAQSTLNEKYQAWINRPQPAADTRMVSYAARRADPVTRLWNGK